MISLRCPDPDATRAVGRRLASLLRPGDVVLLSGELGTGKTLFAGGIGDGLGVDQPVVSPTFVLVRQYEGLLPMFHADIYRLGSTAEIDDLELPAAASDGVLVVERGDAAGWRSVRTIYWSGSRSRRWSPRPATDPYGSWVGRPLAEVAG
jgi:tRNA threonylcarbamoyl adenosine modification protein YjeE